MIEAAHTLRGEAVARFVSGPMLGRAFRTIRFAGNCPDNGLPVLLIANHFSWWDGFIQYRLNRARFGRYLYVMMLEEQLLRHGLLRECGCFSVKKGTRAVIDSLAYCRRILHDPRNMLLLFPQGKIESMHLADYRFEQGVGYLLKQLDVNVQVVFNVNLVDYFSCRKPALTVWYEPYDPGTDLRTETLEQAFNAFARRCRLNQQP